MAKMIANKSPHTSIFFPKLFWRLLHFTFFQICIKNCIVPFCVIFFFYEYKYLVQFNVGEYNTIYAILCPQTQMAV